MKKILFIFLLIAFVVPIGFASAADFNITFAWDQNTEDLASLDKWTLYMRSTAGGEAIQAIDIPYTGGDGPTFEAEQNFIISGVPGEEITRYFVVTAWSKNEQESGFSNEVSHVFFIPYEDVGEPENFTVITVNVGVDIE